MSIPTYTGSKFRVIWPSVLIIRRGLQPSETYLWVRGVRGKFSEGAKSFFLIFSRREMLFPGRKFPFLDPKSKKVLSSFCNFSFPFSIFHLSFFNFISFSIPPFFFPCLSFPGRTADISRSEVSGEHYAPSPRACYAAGLGTRVNAII